MIGAPPPASFVYLERGKSNSTSKPLVLPTIAVVVSGLQVA